MQAPMTSGPKILSSHDSKSEHDSITYVALDSSKPQTAMVHSLTPSPAIPTPISTRLKKRNQLPFSSFQRQLVGNQGLDQAPDDRTGLPLGNRRAIVYGLMGAAIGFSGSGESANAARRGPPQPPQEKKDPNVSGVLAKVLASKKRKEAMKEAMEKLREKGKPVN